VSANAELVAAVVGRVADDQTGPDPVTLARVERDRDAATARYRRDRDPDALEATMRALDQEERQAPRLRRRMGPRQRRPWNRCASCPSSGTTPSLRAVGYWPRRSSIGSTSSGLVRSGCTRARQRRLKGGT
jgi:hypothetical protein